MPSNFRSNTQSGPVKRSCVNVAAIGSSQPDIFVKGAALTDLVFQFIGRSS